MTDNSTRLDARTTLHISGDWLGFPTLVVETDAGEVTVWYSVRTEKLGCLLSGVTYRGNVFSGRFIVPETSPHVDGPLEVESCDRHTAGIVTRTRATEAAARAMLKICQRGLELALPHVDALRAVTIRRSCEMALERDREKLAKLEADAQVLRERIKSLELTLSCT